MSNKSTSFIDATIYKILRPLVKLLIRQGIAYGAFSDIAKRVYVDVAGSDFAIEDKKQSVSRVAILTGINRREVGRLIKEDVLDITEREEYNPAARTISAWMSRKDYTDDAGQPLSLPFEGEVSFSVLARQYGRNVPARAILDELLRIKAVVKDADDNIVLLQRSYIPADNVEETLQIFGEAVSDLFATLNHNLQPDVNNKRLQRTVAYTNIPVECLPKIRTQGQQEAQDFLVQVNTWLSECDRDVNSSLVGSGAKRAGFGIYYFEDDEE